MLAEILSENELDYLEKWYEENFFWLNEAVSALIYNKDEEMLKVISEKVTIFEKVDLQKLIDWLRKNEEKFYKDVLNSDNPNFLITSYYSLYLRFVNTKPISNIEKLTNFLIIFFAIPIILYLRKKEVLPYTSELGGLLLHFLITKKTDRG